MTRCILTDLRHPLQYNFPLRCVLTDDCLLQDAESNWQFDIFSLAEETPGCTLSVLSAHLAGTTGLAHEFSMDEQKFLNYIRKIESGYKDNPYHNRQAEGMNCV